MLPKSRLICGTGGKPFDKSRSSRRVRMYGMRSGFDSRSSANLRVWSAEELVSTSSMSWK